MLSETWMDSVDAFLDIPGYEAYHSVREGKKGGAVSILVSKNLKSNLVLARNCNVYESCLVAVERGTSKLHVLRVYRPPAHTISDFNSLFFDELADVISRPKNLIMCGDFNIDTLCAIDDNYVNEYVMNCQSRNLISCVNLPTRVTESSSTCLNHIWSSISMPNINGALQTDITDHFPVFVCYPGYFAPNEGCQVR